VKWVSVVFTVIAATSGLYAAKLWYAASQIEPSPPIPNDPTESIGDNQWLYAVLEAGKRNGKLNSGAALWTAIAVGAGALASLASLLA
jgi:hypothetical protein